VQTLYNLTLGRTGAITELDNWVSVLNSKGQSAVANGIYRSAESLGRIVDGFYRSILSRAADPAGRMGWTSFLQNGGTIEQMESAMVTSPEFLEHLVTNYVEALYGDILNRSASRGELDGWYGQIGMLGLGGVANAIINSNEHRLDILRGDFQTFLHRTPPDSEITPLADTTMDRVSLGAVILSSPEFFMNG
jgi:hypothetical protein